MSVHISFVAIDHSFSDTHMCYLAKIGLHNSYWSAFAILDHGLHRFVGYLFAGRGVIKAQRETQYFIVIFCDSQNTDEGHHVV